MKINSIIISLVLKQFNERKLRSFLTILGISIGICALISLIMLSSALKSGVTGQLSRLDPDVILIAPKASLAGSSGGPSGFGGFTQADVDTVASVTQIVEVTPFLRATALFKYGREQIRYGVRGSEFESTSQFADFINMDIASGRYLSPNDKNSVNVGATFAKEAFDKELFVGSVIRINDDKYTIQGIFEREGDSNTDNIVVTNIADLRRTFDTNDAVTAISAKAATGADLDIVNERIIRALERKRGSEDFSTTTPAGIIETVNGLIGVVDLVVLSIALISLFVASLGITNSLFTSVFQRTKEIGTMKAIGARNSQILSVFLLESAVLGFTGGFAGILIGLLLASGFISGINLLGFIKLEFALSWGLMLNSIIFSTVLGIVAGMLPAIRASKLKPIDALRFE